MNMSGICLRSTVLAISLLTVLGACNMTVNGVNFGKLATAGQHLSKAGGIDEKQEMQLGDEFAAMLLGASRLHPNPALQQYVNTVGTYLATHSDRPELPWTFAVLDTPDLNAFAIPGGYVFISSGLLANLSSEAELAAVLSHEIVHITERHHLREIERQNSVGLLSTIASVAAEYQQEHHSERPSARAYQNRQIAENVLSAGHLLYTKGLGRDDELAADAMAVRLCARAGYDPYALAAVMQQLDRIGSDSSALSLLLATHPAPAERLSQLEQQLNQLPAMAQPKLDLTGRFIAALQH